MDKQRDFEKGWEEYKAKRKQEIEEMAKVLCINDNFVCETCPSENECFNYKHAKQLYNAGYRKIPENAVVLTTEEYDEFINLQRTHAEDLTNAIQSYEESKEEIKTEYNNHIKNLEKTIDRQSKDLNSQANRIIDLKAKLENKSKETAEKFADRLKEKLNEWLEDNEDLDGKINFGIAQIELIGVKSLDGEIIAESLIEEICKEITDKEVQNGN